MYIKNCIFAILYYIVKINLKCNKYQFKSKLQSISIVSYAK